MANVPTLTTTTNPMQPSTPPGVTTSSTTPAGGAPHRAGKTLCNPPPPAPTPSKKTKRTKCGDTTPPQAAGTSTTSTLANKDGGDNNVINRHGRYSLMITIGKNHAGHRQFTYYKAPTRKLTTSTIETLQKARVHVVEDYHGPCHKILNEAENGLNTPWKRVTGKDVAEHNLVVIFDSDSVKDVLSSDDEYSDDEEEDDDDVPIRDADKKRSN